MPAQTTFVSAFVLCHDAFLELLGVLMVVVEHKEVIDVQDEHDIAISLVTNKNGSLVSG